MNRILQWMALALAVAFLAACQRVAPVVQTPSAPIKAASLDETVGGEPPAALPAPTPTTSPATPASGPPAPAANYGPAPEIATEVWLNTDAPLRLADLRGKVALIEFWTYG